MKRHQNDKRRHAQNGNQQLSFEFHILSDPGVHVLRKNLPMDNHVNDSRHQEKKGSRVMDGHEKVAPLEDAIV